MSQAMCYACLTNEAAFSFGYIYSAGSGKCPRCLGVSQGTSLSLYVIGTPPSKNLVDSRQDLLILLSLAEDAMKMARTMANMLCDHTGGDPEEEAFAALEERLEAARALVQMNTPTPESE